MVLPYLHKNFQYQKPNHTLDTWTQFYLLVKSVADLGGKWRQLPPPFTMKTKVWRPLFGKKSAHYPDPNALFFQCFVLNAGKHVNQGAIQKKNQRTLLNEAQKFSPAFGLLTFHFLFGAPSPNCPSSTSGWIHPCVKYNISCILYIL